MEGATCNCISLYPKFDGNICYSDCFQRCTACTTPYICGKISFLIIYKINIGKSITKIVTDSNISIIDACKDSNMEGNTCECKDTYWLDSSLIQC